MAFLISTLTSSLLLASSPSSATRAYRHVRLATFDIARSIAARNERPAATAPATAAAVSAQARRRYNDRDDTHDRYTTSLAQRQEQASAFHRAQLRELSRPSSSSGSAGSPTLRRASHFDDPRPSRLRASSLDALTRRAASSGPVPVDPLVEGEQQSAVPQEGNQEAEERLPSPQRPSNHRRATSAHFAGTTPHPALRISRRTQSAILYALEEAIRKPNPFTADEEEENAQMSDLGGAARASNGGARNTGPVPIRTPREVMRDRNRREAAKAEEQRKQAEEDRRLSEARRTAAERRVQDVQRTSSQRSSASATQQQNTSNPRGRNSGTVANASALGNLPATGRSSYGVPADAPVPRRTQQNQPETPRQPAPQQRSNPGSAAPAPAAASARSPNVGGDAAAGASSSRNPASSFPHAFERWETLSAHWEGLTSYWLHKLEHNTEEIRETVPNASTLSRQITDLSAAGANLFHAVVELQRLRASSERKFQRWFYETRADNERNREIQASLERSLAVEKSAREEVAQARSNDNVAVENARREVMEMRRELMISKDEARRAWEELGRRNVESLDTAQSLKEGRITVVAGVQVVPYFGQPSRTGSASQRPVTRDGQGYAGSGLGSSGAPGMQGSADERQYYREGPSPTNTDPFTDSGRQPGAPAMTVGGAYPAGLDETLASTAAGSTQAPAVPFTRGGDRSHVTSGDAELFYQHAGTETLLHSPESSRARPAGPRDDIRSEGSFVDTVSEGGTEYAIDAQGEFLLDEHGRRVVFQRRRGGVGGGGAAHTTSGASAAAGAGTTAPPVAPPPRSSESEDDFDTQETIRREQELAAQYGSEDLPEAPSVPPTSAAAMADYPSPTVGAPSPADYEGQGFDNWEDRVRSAHHHPTRLSDVLEEEDERSSRRTVD